jgi:predicted amidophosphoribosyltransferase
MYCEKCDKNYYENESYCSKCGTKLTYKSSYSNYESELPEGYVYDFYGHQRRDPDYERRRQEELRESYRNRW